jgi:3-methyl-2-oxobutanoate hydroxymethyltransferase
VRLGAVDLRRMKGGVPIPILTAYTTPVARALERAGVAAILVGDTVGVVEMGFASTRDVTLEHMAYHVGAVRRGAPATHVIGDLPYLSDADPATALRSSRQLLAAGADSVKLEGAKYDVITTLSSAGISVVGHIGLTPQTAENFMQVGGSAPEAQRILREALAVEAAGAFLLVLEHIPDDLAARITSAVSIPTIGIGAGHACDGQVLVINDAIGLGERWPPFSRQYAHVGESILEAAAMFVAAVREGRY